MWNEGRLASFARESFGNKRFIVVSNRAPYIHRRDGTRVVCTSPAGGLTSALKPIVSAVRGTWVAQASGSADRETSCPQGRLRVPPEDPSFTLRRIWIPQSLQLPYYEGMANQALWPLCHNVYQRPAFRESDWAAYRRVNELFAQAVLDEAAGQPAVVFIQDYHLALLARILKARNPSLTIAQFWHIPWPNPETLGTFPWVEELLRGMLGNDVIGFQTSQHSSNFIAGVESTFPAARIGGSQGPVEYAGRATRVLKAPISIDFAAHQETAASADVEKEMCKWRSRLAPNVKVGIGIDRIDYTKGIPERLRAIGRMFERDPGLRGCFTFVQVGVPSRIGICEYSQLERSIDAEVEAINSRWRTGEWQPIILEKRNLPPVEMMALHRLAAFCMVTSLHDGMNLVAKEFVASRFDLDGVLILSRFAGAAGELRTALLVNPYSEDSMCQAIWKALQIGRGERRRRMAVARSVVDTNNIYRWAGKMMEHLKDASVTHLPVRVTGHERSRGADIAASVA